MPRLRVVTPADRTDAVPEILRAEPGRPHRRDHRRGDRHRAVRRRRPGRAARAGDGADAVQWQELIARTGAEFRLTVTLPAFLTIACLLAAVGVITDSEVLIVGAMVIGRSSARWPRLPSARARRWDLIRRAGLSVG